MVPLLCVIACGATVDVTLNAPYTGWPDDYTWSAMDIGTGETVQANGSDGSTSSDKHASLSWNPDGGQLSVIFYDGTTFEALFQVSGYTDGPAPTMTRTVGQPWWGTTIDLVITEASTVDFEAYMMEAADVVVWQLFAVAKILAWLLGLFVFRLLVLAKNQRSLW